MPTPRLLALLVILLAAVAVAFGGLWWRERAVVAAYRDEAVCWRVVRAGGAAWEDGIGLGGEIRSTKFETNSKHKQESSKRAG